MSEDDKPSIVMGSIVFAIVLIAVVGWTILGGLTLQLSSLYAGFLFLWYWGEKEGAELNRFIPSLVGALLGVALAWFLKIAPENFGTTGTALSLACLVSVVSAVDSVAWSSAPTASTAACGGCRPSASSTPAGCYSGS